MVQPIKIYVGNVPPSARNSELKELFEKFGKVVECDILKEFAFVHMDDSNDAKAAIAGLNDSVWKGGRIRVELSTTKTSKGEPSKREFRASESRGARRGGGGGPAFAPGAKMGRGGGGGGGRGGDRRRPDGQRSMSRGGGSQMMPYPDRFAPNNRRNGPDNGGGPIRDARYSNGSGGQNGRPFYMPDRNRPYPDQGFDQRNNGGGRGGPNGPRSGPPMRNGFGSDGCDMDYSQNQMGGGGPLFSRAGPSQADFARGPSNDYFNRGGADHHRGPHLNGFGNSNFNPFQNQAAHGFGGQGGPAPPPPSMHSDFYRGPSGPVMQAGPGMQVGPGQAQRFNGFDNNNFNNNLNGPPRGRYNNY